MKITPAEANELDVWAQLADYKGINIWAIKEGLIDRDEEIEIPVDIFIGWIK